MGLVDISLKLTIPTSLMYINGERAKSFKKSTGWASVLIFKDEKLMSMIKSDLEIKDVKRESENFKIN